MTTIPVLDQTTRDATFQALLDHARATDTDILLYRVQWLLNGHRDPFDVPERIQRIYLDVANADGWAKVIAVIAQVQLERETDGDDT